MTEVRLGSTARVRFREVSALTRFPLRGSLLYITFLTATQDLNMLLNFL